MASGGEARELHRDRELNRRGGLLDDVKLGGHPQAIDGVQVRVDHIMVLGHWARAALAREGIELGAELLMQARRHGVGRVEDIHPGVRLDDGRAGRERRPLGEAVGWHRQPVAHAGAARSIAIIALEPARRLHVALGPEAFVAVKGEDRAVQIDHTAERLLHGKVGATKARRVWVAHI